MDILINNFCFDVDLEQSALDEISTTLKRGDNIAVACSGGADSVFVLLVVVDIFKRYKEQIKVLHFNHKARANAEIDEDFVADFCEKLQIEAFFGSPENAPEKKTEDEFRQMRFNFFEECCGRENIALIVQGHHADDASETVLMRLSRGNGLEGLCAPCPVSEVGGLRFARPLLNVSKKSIVQMLSSAGISWREDETNAESSHLRNRFRNEAMPVLSSIVPNFSRGVRRSQMLLQEDLNALDLMFAREFERINASIGDTVVLSDAIIGVRALLRRAVMRLLTVRGMLESIRAKAVDKFLDDISASISSEDCAPVKTSVGGGMMIFSPKAQTLSLSSIPENEDFLIEVGIGSHRLPDGRVLRVRRVTLGAEKKEEILKGENDDAHRAILDVSCYGDIKKDVLIVRSRRNGDAYAPIGRRTPKKLKELLNAKKVPILKRKSIFVVCNKKGEILWVPPIAPADKYKIKNSSVVLELTLE